MKKLKKNLFLLASAVLLGIAFVGCEKESSTIAEGSTAAPEPKSTECIIPGLLDSSEIATLVFMREEELLAMDVYLYCKALYNKPIFKNIAQSELTHTTAVKKLLTKYQIPDPAVNHQAGVFVSPDLQALYNSLTVQAAISLQQAYWIGATIEDYDINDIITHMQNDVDNLDILKVLNNLYAGSRNHLRAFSKQLLALNTPYVPQFISPQLYAWIMAGN